jgi:hypothetical protein
VKNEDARSIRILFNEILWRELPVGSLAMHYFNRSLLHDYAYTQRIWSGDQVRSDYFDDFGVFGCPRDPLLNDRIPVQARDAADV